MHPLAKGWLTCCGIHFRAKRKSPGALYDHRADAFVVGGTYGSANATSELGYSEPPI